MKSLLIFIFLAVLSSNSFAGELAPLSINLNSVFSLDTPPPSGPSNFDQIMAKYSTGTLPEFTSAVGWWSGRCFSPELPNEAKPMLLAIAENTIVDSPNNGPDFPPVTHVVRNMLFIMYTQPASPDLFDNMSESLRNLVYDFVNSDDFKSYIAYEANGSLNADPTETVRYSIRKYGDFFYGPAMSITGSNNGKILSACYFFKKVN